MPDFQQMLEHDDFADVPFGGSSKPKQKSDDFYLAWSQSKTPENYKSLMDSLQPVIDSHVSRYSGSDKDALRLQARRIVADSLPRYDASQSQLKTFLDRQLQSLARASREQSNVLSIPEQSLVLGRKMKEESTAFESEYGRQPTVAELSERMRISPKRIRQARRRATVFNAGQFDTVESEGDDDISPDIVNTVETNLILTYIEPDLDPLEQVLVEERFRTAPQRRRGVVDIARQFGISTGAVSQKWRKLEQKIETAQSLLQ